MSRGVSIDPQICHAACCIVVGWLRFRIMLLEVGLKLSELTDSDLGDADVKRLGECHGVRGFLVKIDAIEILVHFSKSLLPEVILQRRPVLSHEERARLDTHEGHTDRVREWLSGGKSEADKQMSECEE